MESLTTKISANRSRVVTNVGRVLGALAILICVLIVLVLLDAPAILAVFPVALICCGWLSAVLEERRTAVRRHLMKPVTCSGVGLPALVNTLTLDISERGFFVETSTPYALMTRFHFRLQLNANEVPVEGDGVVRWINNREPRGMGIEIVRSNAPDKLKALGEAVSPLVHLVDRLSSLGTRWSRRTWTPRRDEERM